MKEWIATYTEDFDQTRKTMTVQEATYTMAYVAVALVIHKTNGIILELNEA